MTALVLANTAPRFGTPEHWNNRIHRVREGGMPAILEMALGRFFSSEFLARSGPEVANVRSVFLGTAPEGYTGCCAALRDFDSREELEKIEIPTLVIFGEKDVSTPLSGNGDILAERIRGAKLVRLRAAHLSNLEAPRSFAAELFAFLQPSARSPQKALEAGIEVRRKVLGHAYVDRAIASKTPLTEDFQELITRYAWGSVWTRPGLDQRTRRLLVLVMMAALGRWEEFRLHLRAGLIDDLEVSDIKESLLQAAIYAGVPVANTAFHIAQEELDRVSK